MGRVQARIIGLILPGSVLVSVHCGIGPRLFPTPITPPADAPKATRVSESALSSTSLFNVYFPEPFDFIYPDDTPENVSDVLSMRATPSEFEPTTFAIKAGNSDLKEVRVKAGDLAGESGVINQENINIRVVKVWTRKAPPRFMKVVLPGHPEMADRIDFGAASFEIPDILVQDEVDFDNQIVGRAWSFDKLPSIPQLAYARTNIPANSSKQFWITVEVPEDAQPGEYTGPVSVLVDGDQAASLELKLTVLPFTLLEPNKSLAVDMTNTIGPFYHYRMPIFIKALEDLRDHGMNSVDLRLLDLSDDEVNAVFGYLSQYGLDRKVTIINRRLETNQVREIVNTAEDAGIQPFFYGFDEPWHKPPFMPYPCGLALHVQVSRDIHANGGAVVTQITQELAHALADRNGQLYRDLETFDTSSCQSPVPVTPQNFTLGSVFEPLDMAYEQIWFREETKFTDFDIHQYIEQIQQDPQSKAPYPEIYYYNPVFVAYPFENRLLYGFFLFNSGMDGARAWAYQRTVGDPYDDFDGNQSDANLVYPSQEGLVPTYSWEAIREGVDDLRYAETADAMIREVESSDPALGSALRQRFNNILVPFIALTYDDAGTQPWKKCDNLYTLSQLMRRQGSAPTPCQNSKRIDELYGEQDLRLARDQMIDLMLEVVDQ